MEQRPKIVLGQKWITGYHNIRWALSNAYHDHNGTGWKANIIVYWLQTGGSSVPSMHSSSPSQ